MNSREVALRCACGKIRGTALDVSPNAGCRLICYCGDCQAFARFLGRPDVLDEWGGTDLFQFAPAKLRLSSEDTLSCVRLSDKGMYRWYCSECKTPIGNTLTPSVPFVGLIHSFMDFGGDAGARDAALGEPIGYARGEAAIGDLPDERRAKPWRATARALRLIAKWWLTKAGSPSAFFDANRAPSVIPRILTPDERRALSPQ